MKTKQILFTIALFFSVTFVNAQDKYEFMTIVYTPHYKKIDVSINGEQFISKDIAEKISFPYTNSNPILKKVAEYQDLNWELLNFTNVSASSGNIEYFANLRRRIK